MPKPLTDEQIKAVKEWAEYRQEHSEIARHVLALIDRVRELEADQRAELLGL